MIWLILVLALFLRLINLNQSLWWDEAINVVYAKSSSFVWFLTKYPIGDFHPPLFFVILWTWGHLFSFGEFIIRLPSVIFGLLTVFLTYLIGKKLYSKNIGLIAAIFLSLAPLHIYYSQEARMYSLAAFAVALSNYFFLTLIRNEKFAFWGYALSVCLVLYSDYVAYFILPVHFLLISIYYKKIIKRYILSLFLGIIPALVWIPIFFEQLRKGIETSNLISGWKDVVGGVRIKQALLLPAKILIGRITFENKLIYTLLVAIASLPYVFAFKKTLNSFTDKINFLLFWMLIPTGLAFIFSFFVPIFSYFRFLFILPAFYLLLAYGVDQYRLRFRIVLIVFILIFEIFTTEAYLLNPKFHREDWKGASDFVNKNSDNQTITLHKNNEIPASFKYYKLESVNSLAAFNKIPARSFDDLIDLNKSLLPFNRIFLFDYLVDITDPNRLLEKELEKIGFKKIKNYDFRGVGFIELYVH